jgi:hypothetical protein
MLHLAASRRVLDRAGGSSWDWPPAPWLAGSIGIGVTAGVATAAGVVVGRKALTAAKIGKGHPLKHRVLDVAAGAMQPKYPLNAMSTYLNGFPCVRRRDGPTGGGDTFLHPLAP